jgi:cytochrome c oxidase cbb3-type subunit I/II
MYFAAIVQGLMWKEFTVDGVLKYPNFLETTLQILPMYALRSVGGTLYLIGVFIMVYNIIKTAAAGTFVPEDHAEAPALTAEVHAEPGEHWHRRLFERRPIQLTLFATIAILIGGAVEMIPTFLIDSNVPTIASVKPYTPLELEGRDIYIREGCVGCHSQLVRPFRSETARYGEYSKSGEYVYDHPFLWGSKRTGPDLQRVGKKYPDSWHYHHMYDPASMAPGSIMPSYIWLHENTLDISLTESKIAAMRTLGVPYPEGFEAIAVQDLQKQAQAIAENLKTEGVNAASDTEIIAMIAYLQRLGTDIKLKNTATAK